MSLEIIGAGFGRTGTLSMKTALETLGFGPCHHMLEVTANDEQREIWRHIAGGGEPDWERAFMGYRSTVDWPGAYFWRELSEYYPEAKILLTVRSPDSWYKSASNTIFDAIKGFKDRESVGVKLIQERIFAGDFDDRDKAIAIYKRNIAEVQKSFDADRLLTFTVGDGWEPLCQFLGKPVPDSPFPSSNSTAEFRERFRRPDNRTS